MKQKTRKFILSISLIILLTLAAVSPVLAFDGRGGETIIIAAGEVIEDDLYVTANEFTLDGTVEGDLVAAGGIIEINGVVEGDLIAAGREIILNGEIGDDVRIAGAALTLNDQAQVGDDLVAAGYHLGAAAESNVGGDVVYGGNQAMLAGTIGDDLLMGGRGLELDGTVNGDANLAVSGTQDGSTISPFVFMPEGPTVPTVAGGLTFGNAAHIDGDLDYTSQVRATDLPANAVAGQITFDQVTVETSESATLGSLTWFLNYFRSFAGLFLVGALLLWVTPKFVRRSATALQNHPLSGLGWGVATLLGLIVTGFVILLVMVLLAILLGWATLDNLLGMVILLGLVALFALIGLSIFVMAYVAEIVVGYLAGRLILNRLKPDWAETRLWPLLVGLLLFVILSAIPYLGPLITIAVVLFGLGALWLWTLERLQPTAAA